VKKLMLSCVLLCATGCATQPEQPKLVVQQAPKTVRVEVPVMRPCVAAKDVPVPPVPTKVDVTKADQRQLAAAAAVDLKQQDLYIEKAKAIIAACAQ
jgi:hypothetical protein